MKKWICMLLFCVILFLCGCEVMDAGVEETTVAPVPVTTAIPQTVVPSTAHPTTAAAMYYGPLYEQLKEIAAEAYQRALGVEVISFQNVGHVVKVAKVNADLCSEIQEDVVLVDPTKWKDSESYKAGRYLLFLLRVCEVFPDCTADTQMYDPFSGRYPPAGIWLYPGYQEAGFESALDSWKHALGVEYEPYRPADEAYYMDYWIVFRQSLYCYQRKISDNLIDKLFVKK